MIEASRFGYARIVQLLLKDAGGLDLIDARKADGSTAVYGSCYASDYSVIKLLLDAGADPRIPNNDGETPLELAKRVHGPDPSPFSRLLKVSILIHGENISLSLSLPSLLTIYRLLYGWKVVCVCFTNYG